jgi:hypothetical protein
MDKERGVEEGLRIPQGEQSGAATAPAASEANNVENVRPVENLPDDKGPDEPPKAKDVSGTSGVDSLPTEVGGGTG